MQINLIDLEALSNLYTAKPVSMHLKFTNYIIQLTLQITSYLAVTSQILHLSGQSICINNQYTNFVQQTYTKNYSHNCHSSYLYIPFQYRQLKASFSASLKIATINKHSSKQKLQSIIFLVINSIKESSIHLFKVLTDTGIIYNKHKQLQNRIKFSNVIKNIKQILINKKIYHPINDKVQTMEIQQASPSSAVKNVTRIVQKGVKPQKDNFKTGGYSLTYEMDCDIYESQQNVYQKKLAIKQLHAQKNKKIDNLIYYKKMENQRRIVMEMGNRKKYLLNYYVYPNQNKVYMDYYKYSLKDYLKFPYNSIEDLVTITIELIRAVKQMHLAQIIHRDLKPSNILIDFSKRKLSLKIIDFGQSTTTKDKFENLDKLGSTLPYSPPQNAFIQIKQDFNGFNALQIDNWSSSITGYEIINKKMPVCYSKCFSTDIVNGWATQFLLSLPIRKNQGVRIIEDIINLICIGSLRIKQKNRMDLQTMQSLLLVYQQYLTTLMKQSQIVI